MLAGVRPSAFFVASHTDAWIEILPSTTTRTTATSHPTRDAWIEIMRKYGFYPKPTSHPTRDAWIEISEWQQKKTHRRRRPTRDAWIEICADASWRYSRWYESHPTRDAWIEIVGEPKAANEDERIRIPHGCVD